MSASSSTTRTLVMARPYGEHGPRVAGRTAGAWGGAEMGRRSMVLAAGLWLAVVVVVSVVTWTVIDAAGRDVTARPTEPTRRPASTTPAPRSSTVAPPPAAQPQERTWAGRAGSVTARCTGGTISLVSATPADGWRMEVEDRGPSRVRVELRSLDRSREDGDDHSGSGDGDEVEVRAECSGGVPGFRVDS